MNNEHVITLPTNRDKDLIRRISADDKRCIESVFFQDFKEDLIQIIKDCKINYKDPNDLIFDFIYFLRQDNWAQIQISNSQSSLASTLLVAATKYYRYYDDRKLVELVLRNDPIATYKFTSICYDIAKKMPNSSQYIVEETVGNVLLDLAKIDWSYLRSFRFESSLYTWLNRIIYNETLKILKREQRIPTTQFEESFEPHKSMEYDESNTIGSVIKNNDEDALFMLDNYSELRIIINNNFSEKQKRIIQLIYEGYSSKEIASILEYANVNSVNQRRDEIKKKLKRLGIPSPKTRYTHSV